MIIDEVDEKQVRDSVSFSFLSIGPHLVVCVIQNRISLQIFKLCRNHVVEATDICMKWIDLLGESAEACNRTRLKFFLRCITCNQLDAKVFAFHEVCLFIYLVFLWQTFELILLSLEDWLESSARVLISYMFLHSTRGLRITTSSSMVNLRTY